MIGSELLEAYAKGERGFSCADLVRVELNGANLIGANLMGANLMGADLGGANLIGANLIGANLMGANLCRANLCRADLCGADLGGANLMGADLGGAYLGGANLIGANLNGANLCRANFGEQWIVQGTCRSDGHWFHLQKLRSDKEPMVKAGCRLFSLPEAREHWQKTRGGTALGDQTFAILDCLERVAKIRGLI